MVEKTCEHNKSGILTLFILQKNQIGDKEYIYADRIQYFDHDSLKMHKHYMYICMYVVLQMHPVMSDSLQPHGL